MPVALSFAIVVCCGEIMVEMGILYLTLAFLSSGILQDSSTAIQTHEKPEVTSQKIYSLSIVQEFTV